VFEERCRVMVRRCIDAKAPFGVVLIREGSEVAPNEASGLGQNAHVSER
jgi:Lon protease-like protein